MNQTPPRTCNKRKKEPQAVSSKIPRHHQHNNTHRAGIDIDQDLNKKCVSPEVVHIVNTSSPPWAPKKPASTFGNITGFELFI